MRDLTPGTHIFILERHFFYHHVWVIIVISLKINLLLINNTKYKSFWMVYCVASRNILLKGFTRFCRCFGKFVSAADPDLQIRGVPSNPFDHCSWKINWPFHISRTINSAFYVSEEKINHQNHVSRGMERWFHNSRRIKQAIHGSRKYPLPPSSVSGLDLIRSVV